MPGETPDWGVLSAQATVYPVNDLGELAARLGSPITHDRRGDIVWWDDFEWGLNKWDVLADGLGAAVVLSSAFARNGRCSALLTAGSTGLARAGIVHRSPYPVLSAMGFEVSIMLPVAVESIEIYLQVFDGSNRRWFGLMWDNASNELRYMASTGLFVSFATGLDLYAAATLFHTFKLVGDATEGNYVRALVNERTYSLAGIDALAGADATSPHVLIAAIVNGDAGQNDQAYADDAILTQNEPV